MAHSLATPRPPRRRTRAARQALSRPPLQRMMLLHAKLQGGEYPNCRAVSRELEVSAKTIQRDLEFMRDRLNLPIGYDQARLGFYYTEPVSSFPAIEVSEGELVALFIAQKAMAQYEGAPFEQQLAAAFRKLTDGLQDKITFGWSELDSAISFRSIGASIADLEIFETVSKAVVRSVELTFGYRKIYGSKHEDRRIRPYHLGYIEGQWYLIGWDLSREQIRTFALPRIQEPRLTTTRFRRPADFSIARHLGGSFGVFSGAAQHEVRIRFDAMASQIVSERQWHVSQRMKRLADGSIELTLQLGSLPEVERWVLSWGKRAKVIEPPELIERLKKSIAAMQSAYAE